LPYTQHLRSLDFWSEFSITSCKLECLLGSTLSAKKFCRGTKWTMAIGGIGYCVYSAAFLCYNHTQNEGFVIFSGALLGFCAAFLWCAQGVVMMVSIQGQLHAPAL
jgi:hypothetical protein